MNKSDGQAGISWRSENGIAASDSPNNLRSSEKYDYQLSNDESFNEGLAVLEQKRETEKGSIETKSAATPDPTFQDLSSGAPGTRRPVGPSEARPAKAEQQRWRNGILSGALVVHAPAQPRGI